MNVVKKIKTKINQGHRQSITLDVSFIQVPTSCSYDQACNLFFQFANRGTALLQLVDKLATSLLRTHLVVDKL
jgi:hypothetical protein